MVELTDDGLFGDSGTPLLGSDLSLEDVLAQARQRFKWVPLCVVKDWVILDAIVTDDERAKVKAAGCEPMFLFAHNVLHDDNRRFEPGHWVRSSMGTSFKDGYLFSTRNTIYVLVGSGYRKQSSIQAIFSIF